MKNIFTLLIALGVATTVSACGECGCSIDAFSSAVLPDQNIHFIRVGFSQQHFTGTWLDEVDAQHKVSEHYQQLQLSGRYAVNSRWILSSELPVFFNNLSIPGALSDKQKGFGDLRISVRYNILADSRSKAGNLIQNLSIGGGLKVPTGLRDSETDHANEFPEFTFQPGSGSWDPFFIAGYNFRYKNWGWSFDQRVQISTVNKENTRYGHRYQAALRSFYWLGNEKLTALPWLGYQFDFLGETVQDGFSLPYTSGDRKSVV